MDLVRRVEIAQAVFDRFHNRPLRFCRCDCVRMFRYAMQLARGADPAPRLQYTERNALSVLRRRGWADLAEALDAHGLQRIPLAMHLPADLVLIPSEMRNGEHDVGALGVCLGNDRALAFLDLEEGAGPRAYAAPVQPATVCWRLA